MLSGMPSIKVHPIKLACFMLLVAMVVADSLPSQKIAIKSFKKDSRGSNSKMSLVKPKSTQGSVVLPSQMGFFERAFQRAKMRLATDMDLGFVHAFVSSLAMILVSELGDKTFFIAAIMAMRHSRTTVFMGAIAALGLMTVLSALLGFATTVIPKSVTHVIASVLFLLFGVKMLYEGWKMRPEEAMDEYEEVQADLKKREAEMENQSQGVTDVESGVHYTRRNRFFRRIFSYLFLQSFVMTFLAEWGDRSQITTIILAAREEVIGVILGGTLGHCLCTGLAVIGGHIVAQRISVRTVTLIGGVVFIVFAFSSFMIRGD